MSSNLMYINTSLSIMHMAETGTKLLSFITISAENKLFMSLIRISGSMQGDSGGDLVLDTRVGFAICSIVATEEFTIRDFGIYGASIKL